MANLDLLNAFWKRAEQESEWRGYASTIRQARPFSLDDELTEIVGRLMTSKPAELHKYLLSARLPYPVMWLEASFEPAFAQIEMQVRDDEGAFWLTKSAPQRIGWLLSQTPNGIITATRVCRVEDPVSGEVGDAMMYPLVYMFSADQRMNVDGQTFRTLEGTLDPEVLRALRTWNKFPLTMASPWALSANGVSVKGHLTEQEIEDINGAYQASPLYETCVGVLEPRAVLRLMNPRMEETESLYDRSMSLLMAGHNDQHGDIAFIASALALLNEVPVKYVPFRPSGSLRAGGRLRPYMSSSIVTIEVPASRRRLKDVRDRLKEAAREHATRARHEVRGHWRHAYKLPRAASDNHRWEAWVDRTGRPCWRTWIEHHERGSGKIGFVRQTYEAVRGRGAMPRVVEGNPNECATA